MVGWNLHSRAWVIGKFIFKSLFFYSNTFDWKPLSLDNSKLYIELQAKHANNIFTVL